MPDFRTSEMDASTQARRAQSRVLRTDQSTLAIVSRPGPLAGHALRHRRADGGEEVADVIRLLPQLVEIHQGLSDQNARIARLQMTLFSQL